MPGLISHHSLLLILHTQNKKHIAQFRSSQISVGSSEVGIRLMLNRDIWRLSAERLGHSPGEFTVSLLFHKQVLPENWLFSASSAMVYGLRHLSEGINCPGKSGTQVPPLLEKLLSVCNGFMANRTLPSLPPACASLQGCTNLFPPQSSELLASSFSLPKRSRVSEKIEHYSKTLAARTKLCKGRGLLGAGCSP